MAKLEQSKGKEIEAALGVGLTESNMRVHVKAIELRSQVRDLQGGLGLELGLGLGLGLGIYEEGCPPFSFILLSLLLLLLLLLMFLFVLLLFSRSCNSVLALTLLVIPLLVSFSCRSLDPATVSLKYNSGTVGSYPCHYPPRRRLALAS